MEKTNEKVSKKQESTDFDVSVDVVYTDSKNIERKHKFRTTYRGLQGNTLFLNLILNNSLSEQKEFKIQVKKV